MTYQEFCQACDSWVLGNHRCPKRFTRVCVVNGQDLRDRYNVKATMEIQDDGKTLKIYIEPRDV